MLSVAPRYQSEWSYCDRVIEPAHSSAATNAWGKAVGAAWATGDVAAWGGGVGAKASAACGGGAGCGGAGFAHAGMEIDDGLEPELPREADFDCLPRLPPLFEDGGVRECREGEASPTGPLCHGIGGMSGFGCDGSFGIDSDSGCGDGPMGAAVQAEQAEGEAWASTRPRKTSFHVCVAEVDIDEIDEALRRNSSCESFASSSSSDDEDEGPATPSLRCGLMKTEDGPAAESAALDYLVHRYFESDELNAPSDVAEALGQETLQTLGFVVAGRLKHACEVLEATGRLSILPSSVRLSEPHLDGMKQLAAWTMDAARAAL